MASILTPNVRELVGQLITKISGFDETSEHFKTVQDFAFSHVASPDYYFFQTRKEMEKIVHNLSEKFQFHGFLSQAKDLKSYAKKFFDSSANKDDLEVRLAIVKLLLEISNSPTKHFIENPELFKHKPIEEDVIEDWTAYLNDTKIVPVQTFSDSSDWSDDCSESDKSSRLASPVKIDDVDAIIKFTESYQSIYKPNIHEEAKIARENLLKTIQSEWWNKDAVSILPTSDIDESKIAIKWDKFVNDVTMGLLTYTTNIVPEYKIMRELLWQFFAPNTCFAFGFENSKLIPKSGMSIGSVRANTFQYFLYEFVPYFEMLKTFRSFEESLRGEYFVTSIPDTYRSYNGALQEIMSPVFEKIRDIENTVRKQETPITILNIASELLPIFKDIELLCNIHTALVKNFKVDQSFQNATNLLSKLYYGLLNSSDKTTQNLYLTLYLQSLYKYLTVIEIWLTQDMLDDPTDEFVIQDKNPKDTLGSSQYATTFRNISKSSRIEYHNQDWQMQYVVRELDQFSQMDGMLHIICTRIMQLGKNIHLLRLLGKLHLITEEYGCMKESLHQEFIRKVLNEASNYLHQETEVSEDDDFQETNENNEVKYEDAGPESPGKYSVICPEQKISETGMDCIDNFLDFTDGFLATVFEPYLFQETCEKKEKEKSLYEIISQSIDKIFPVKQILERTFLEALNARYSVPGRMVKNIMIHQFDLKRHFNLIKHLYLFEDDIIFPFYKKMFNQFESQQMWGNFFWLTSQLQDLLMDLYPDAYEDCRVDVDLNWRLCVNPIAACDMISLHCKIPWPVNIIIRSEHIIQYHEVFKFILKLKWALNTLNRLRFLDIEPRNKQFKQRSPLIKERIRKLESLRFLLLNVASSIHHYVLGHLFSSLRRKFDKDLDEAYDLESLISAHDKFIKRIYLFCSKLRDNMSEVHGFGKILTLIAQLRTMWNNLNNLDDSILTNCEKEYLKCHKFLRPIIELDIATF